MVSKNSTVVLALTLPAAALADIICALGSGVSAYKPEADQRPSADTMQIVQRVDAAFKSFCYPKCPDAAMLRNDTAPNLMLTANQDGARLVYSPQFFAAVYQKFGDTGILALLEHVYAHAIDETVPSDWIPTKWNPELRADAWAGCALAKSNLPAAGLSSALAALAMYPPPSETAWNSRAAALRLGFGHCGGAASQFDTAANTVTKTRSNSVK